MAYTPQEIFNRAFDPTGQAIRVLNGGASGTTVRMEYDANGNLIYKGEAEAGAGTTEPKWQIQKFEYDANGNLVSVLFAEGSASYDKVWDNRASYNYL